MEDKYFNQLDEVTRKFVLKLENELSQEIGVEIDDSKEHLGCGESNYKPIIYVPREDHLPSSSVFHELLHIQGSYVQGIPSLKDNDRYKYWNANTYNDLKVLDNNIEHLVIVPIEIEQYPERKSYWCERTRSGIERVRAHSNTTIQIHNFYQNYSLVRIVLQDVDLLDLMVKVASELGQDSKIDGFIESATQYIGNKEMLVSTFFKYFELDLDCAELSYCDCVNRNQFEKSLI